ncbi:hypothetical protein ACHHYP_00794 [Achlya hypogyna]|uniref:Ion transport domain-containing protein n=1 Tax=Achlya hypogyna TaxID=1202772 RepID=A0A1V9ZAQ5_ACHHY|nr:hypothetical protein ACHHYP_00794 [Achlya hypogyna]
MLGQPQKSIREHTVNAVDAEGRTSLSHACEAGDYALVQKLLLEPFIDINLEDISGMSPLEYAENRGHHQCAALIKDEAYYRANDPNNAFLAHLRAELTVTDGADFDERLFRQAIENDPNAAAKYLDQFVSTSRYNYQFTQLVAVCGRSNVKSSALYSILNDSIIGDTTKHDCLQHVVLQRMLDIKWELFGARKYFQQLLLYIVMLMSMTILVSSGYSIDKVMILYDKDFEDWTDEDSEMAESSLRIQPQFVVWLFTCIFTLFGFVHLRHLKPEMFTKLTRWMYDGRYVFDAAFVIPQVAVYKSKARVYLFLKTLLWAVVLTIPCVVGLAMLGDDNFGYFLQYQAIAAPCVLWACAAYFLLLEILELYGEDPWIYHRRQNASCIGKVYWTFILVFVLPFATPFMTSYRKYYASFTNKLQLLTYSLILGPFAWLHYIRFHALMRESEQMSEALLDIYLCLGAFLTISLWMLSLQYLEVNKTAGYLLPIVKDVMRDVWDFLIFYGVFQCGLSCAYYFIFQQKADSYKTLWASFRATYFVMYGENGVGDFNAKVDKPKQHALPGSGNKTQEHVLPGPIMHFGFILRMFHCAVMVVLLLNLLLAMMNKTVDRNWDKLQTRALASYARCILRLETMLGQTEAARAKLSYISTKSGPVLNPIFDEIVPKHAQLESGTTEKKATVEEAIESLALQNARLEQQLAQLTTMMQGQMGDILAATQKLHRDEQIND